MVTTLFDRLPSLLPQLANPAARALALAAGAGLGLAAFRVRSASLRLFIWTAVLYAALAMPLLGWILPPLSFPIPAVFHRETEQPLPHRGLDSKTLSEASQQSSTSSPISQGRARTTALPPAATPPSHRWYARWSSLPWGKVAAGIYLLMASLLLVRFVVGLVFARRITQASDPIRDPRLALKLFCRARASGLSSIPRVAESKFVSVPVTMGAFRSTILLPSNWREWDDAKLDAVVAHEVSHIARRDSLTQ